MSDASNHAIVLARSQNQDNSSDSSPGPTGTTETGAFPIESYADRLMDDLFEDVERLLDGGAKLPTEPAPPEYVSLKPLPLSQISVPTALLPHQPGFLESPRPIHDELTVKAESSVERYRESGRLLDRLLLGVGCVSLATALIVWIASQGWGMRLVTLVSHQAAPVATTGTTPNPQDAQLAKYIQQALAAIDQKDTPNSPATSKSGKLPATPVPLTNLPPLSNMPTVAVPGTTRTNPSVAAAPAVPGKGIPITIYLPPNLYSTSGYPTAAYPATGTVVAQPATAPAPASAPVRSEPTATYPGLNRTLVGLLENGQQSAALFEMNGTTQRFYIGESIGSSGWTLVEVSKQEAVMRRNGEVRSIYVGQKF